MKQAQGHFSLLIFQTCLVCSSQEEEGARSSCQILAGLFSKPAADHQQMHSFSAPAFLSQSFLLSSPFYFQRLLCPSAQHGGELYIILEKGVSKHSRYTRCSPCSRTPLIPPTTRRTDRHKIRVVLCIQHCRSTEELSPSSSTCCKV